MPVVPVVIRSFESCLTASLFLWRKTCSSACCFKDAMVALAFDSCSCNCSWDVEIAFATEDAVPVKTLLADDGRSRVFFSDGGFVAGVGTFGAGDPKVVEGEP